MRRQSYCSSFNSSSVGGEPLIVVEESILGEEDSERQRNESPPRCLDPDSPSLNPYLLSPWRDNRKHSLPTPQCTSGITASQVRRLSERGGEGSGPSPREAAFLATLSQAPAPQPGGRRHSVVTISKVPHSLFGNRRESIAALSMGASRVLSSRRESTAGITGPPSNSGSTHNLQLDIMDDIAEIKARKVRLKMYRTSSKERVCEVQPLEGSSSTQRYIQQHRRFSDFTLASIPAASTNRRRASEMPFTPPSKPKFSQTTGIICSNTDLISILSSLTSSATEINRCGEEFPMTKENKSGKTAEQKRRNLKNFRSNSFDISILHEAGCKLTSSGSMKSTNAAPSNWFIKRHQPMSKKQKNDESISTLFNLKFDKLKVAKFTKEALIKSPPTKESNLRHKVVWDGLSGTKVDAQVLGSAIEEFLTSQRGSEPEGSSNSCEKPSVSPRKSKTSSGKMTTWFSSGNKEEEQTESCEPSICSSLKDLFVK
ncbi:uncharacterized protein LOC122500047 [Leptopilina heterotoma]|uniref:uncharacterized protein LOC122500047 n=1 Tax=Leptopilina heterotoma TaxID=63436 RepID=UPI001CA971A6|nr:uncharacterized protein LOC122500047 [Leptopilina heterotoma]XP_043464685.1 uncharacterized protein LOC122500047 [Leptopilina heterotoma]